MFAQVTAPSRHREAMLSLQAEIAATQVFEHAAEAANDSERLAALDEHERGLWDALMHFNELGGGKGR